MCGIGASGFANVGGGVFPPAVFCCFAPRSSEGAPQHGQGASLSSRAVLQNVQSIVVHSPSLNLYSQLLQNGRGKAPVIYPGDESALPCFGGKGWVSLASCLSVQFVLRWLHA